MRRGARPHHRRDRSGDGRRQCILDRLGDPSRDLGLLVRREIVHRKFLCTEDEVRRTGGRSETNTPETSDSLRVALLQRLWRLSQCRLTRAVSRLRALKDSAPPRLAGRGARCAPSPQAMPSSHHHRKSGGKSCSIAISSCCPSIPGMLSAPDGNHTCAGSTVEVA